MCLTSKPLSLNLTFCSFQVSPLCSSGTKVMSIFRLSRPIKYSTFCLAVLSIKIPFSTGYAATILDKVTSNDFLAPEKISLLDVRIKCPMSRGVTLFSEDASKLPNR